jgi:hypothetical protein
LIFFALKYRNIEIHQSMNTNLAPTNWGGKTMEFLIPLGILVVWIILQAWVLPRLGVKT